MIRSEHVLKQREICINSVWILRWWWHFKNSQTTLWPSSLIVKWKAAQIFAVNLSHYPHVKSCSLAKTEFWCKSYKTKFCYLKWKYIHIYIYYNKPLNNNLSSKTSQNIKQYRKKYKQILCPIILGGWT